jgi:hypothetical protein
VQDLLVVRVDMLVVEVAVRPLLTDITQALVVLVVMAIAESTLGKEQK